MPTIHVNGADLNYVDRGRGEPVVFSHGYLFDCRMFDAQIRALEDRYRCIAWDHRGQGGSSVTASGYSMDELAGDATELIRMLGAAPCHFVGLSMGGFVGLRLAARRPELIRSLTLIGSSAEPETKALKYRALAAVVRLLGVRSVIGPVMRILFGRTFRSDPKRRDLRDELRRQLTSVRIDGALKALDGIAARPSVVGELDRIRAPTLIIVGEDDAATGPARSRLLQQHIQGSRLVILPRAGHSATIEEPDAVTAALAPFLNEHRAAPAAAG